MVEAGLHQNRRIKDSGEILESVGVDLLLLANLGMGELDQDMVEHMDIEEASLHSRAAMGGMEVALVSLEVIEVVACLVVPAEVGLD